MVTDVKCWDSGMNGQERILKTSSSLLALLKYRARIHWHKQLHWGGEEWLIPCWWVTATYILGGLSYVKADLQDPGGPADVKLRLPFALNEVPMKVVEFLEGYPACLK